VGIYPHDLGIDDPELVEGRLHQLPPYFWCGVLVGHGTIAAHQQCMIQCCFDGLVVLPVLPDERPGLSQFSLYPALFGLECVQGQGVS
jgi:hypothetical protein